MPFLAILCPLTLCDCTTLISQVSRFEFTAKGACLLVRASFFENQTDATAGGAIRVGSESQCEITDSSFLFCRTPGHGGALSLDSPNATVLRCCGTGCSAVLGPFVQIGGNGSFAFLALLLCPLTSTSGRGVICSETASFANFSNNNWTACPASEGSTVLITAELSQFAFRLSTVASSAGDTGVDSSCAVSPLVELCNFYNNSVDPSFTAVYTRQTGVLIRACVFSNNSRDVGFSGFGGDWEIADSFFTADSVQLPNDSFVLDGNVFLTVTASLAVAQFDPDSCATRPVSAKPSESLLRPSESPSATAEAQPSVGVILGVVACGLFVVLVFVVGYCLLCRKQVIGRERSPSDSPKRSAEGREDSEGTANVADQAPVISLSLPLGGPVHAPRGAAKRGYLPV
jgi:hypothetical protein